MRLEIKTEERPFMGTVVVRCLFQEHPSICPEEYLAELSNEFLRDHSKMMALDVLGRFMDMIQEDPEKKYLKQQLRKTEAQLRASNAKLDQVKEIVE